MYKIMRVSFLVVCFLISGQLLSAESNVLKGVEYQQTEQDKNRSIELGVIKLYFQKKPNFNVLPHYREQSSTVFFFPSTYIETQEYKKMVGYLDALNNKYFSVRLESVDTPVQGVKLSIYHDPEAVEITHDFFPSSDLQPEVIFRVNNKALRLQLERKDNALLSTACQFFSNKTDADFFVQMIT